MSFVPVQDSPVAKDLTKSIVIYTQSSHELFFEVILGSVILEVKQEFSPFVAFWHFADHSTTW